jgi:hypothetical protein
MTAGPKTDRHSLESKLSARAKEAAARRAGCEAWASAGRSGRCPVCGESATYSLFRYGSHRHRWRRSA